jgi:hypothetical protein
VCTKGTSAEIIEGFVATIIELMYWLKLFKFLLELLRWFAYLIGHHSERALLEDLTHHHYFQATC